MKSARTKILLAALSGLLLIANLPVRQSFRLGFITGLVHYLSLLYWVVPVMRTYGYLPLYLSVVILFLFAAVLSFFPAVFSMTLAAIGITPLRCLITMPLLWVALEYIRTFIFTGFPWALLGHSQYLRHHLIQIADLFGAYGVSFLIALGNLTVFLTITFISRKTWHSRPVSKSLVIGASAVFAVGFLLTWIYGSWRIKATDNLMAATPTARVAVIQGNIDQSLKWDPVFQDATIKTYHRLSLAAKSENPDMIVWPESATPFFLFYDKRPTENVLAGIRPVSIF
jgi:apolipoprotein N-acyltransferase